MHHRPLHLDPDHRQLVYDPVDPNIVYVATDGGVYRSDDGGRNWVLRSFGVTWADIRNGMARTFNGNPTPPCSVRHLAVLPDNSNSQVAGGTVVVRDAAGNEVFHQSWIFRSPDQGNSWLARKRAEVHGGRCLARRVRAVRRPTLLRRHQHR